MKFALPSFLKPEPSQGLLNKSEGVEENGRQLLTRLAEEIVARHLSVPAVFFLELMKPLSFLGSQTLVFFGPILTLIFPENPYYRFTELMEDDRNVEFLIREIERLEGIQSPEEEDNRPWPSSSETANKKS